MEGVEVLRDRYGNRIAEIQTTGSKQVLRDKHGNRLGEYHANTNRTRDKYGNPVGSGNLLPHSGEVGSLRLWRQKPQRPPPTYEGVRLVAEVLSRINAELIERHFSIRCRHSALIHGAACRGETLWRPAT